MEKNTGKMHVVKNEKATKSIKDMTADERKEAIASLEQEINQRNREIAEKFYVVEGSDRVAKAVLKFMTEEAKWKFTEAIGVVECIKEIEKALDKTKGGKEFFLQVLPLEAIWFFINKVEGTGLESAVYYQDNLLKPIGDALGRVKADRDADNQMTMDLGSLEVGADFEAEPEQQPADVNA